MASVDDNVRASDAATAASRAWQQELASLMGVLANGGIEQYTARILDAATRRYEQFYSELQDRSRPTG